MSRETIDRANNGFPGKPDVKVERTSWQQKIGERQKPSRGTKAKQKIQTSDRP